MQCDQFELRLNEILDQGGSIASSLSLGDSDLQRHVHECAACRSLATALGAVLDGTEQIPPIIAPVDLTSRVLNELHFGKKELATTRSWLPGLSTLQWASLATAASVLIAASLFFARARQPMGKGTKEVLVHHQVAPKTDASLASADAYRDLAAQARESLASAMLILPGDVGVNSGSNEASEPMLDPQWSQGVTAGFEPLTRSTAGALDSLWRTLPLTEDSRS